MVSTIERKINEMLGMSAKELDDLGVAYDNDEVVFTDEDQVFEGSPFDYIGKKRETFIIDAVDFRDVCKAAQLQKCSKSAIYRKAIHQYLKSLDLKHA